MADRRPETMDQSRAKRMKTSPAVESDPKSNPYLAHMYEESEDQYSNGYPPKPAMNGKGGGSSLNGLTRHQTTSTQAMTAEDGPNNPFNGRPLSKQYFNILKTRRNLPVHQQR